jgi:hypothetical protein
LRLTSAYHPQANGLTERANQTIIDILNKVVNADDINWTKWLGWTQYCYNTIIHSSTGFSTFKLAFGVEPNEFKDYRLMMSCNNENNQLNNRFLEIRRLIMGIRKNIESNSIPIGIKVFVKNEWINPKLTPIYKGPFFISAVNENLTYTRTY